MELFADKYQIIDEFYSEGGNGIVVKVIDVELSSDTPIFRAIKYPRSGHRDVVDAFKKEAQTAAQLSETGNSYVIPILTSDLNREDRPYVVMPFYDWSADSVLNDQGRLTWPHVVNIALQTCLALKSDEILHLDIKPQNILLTSNKDTSNAVVCDYGHSKTAGSESLLSFSGGTNAYMSPEQSSPQEYYHPTYNPNPIGHASDVYSLGITMFQLLTGQLPFTGHPMEIKFQHKHKGLPLDDLNEIPDRLREIISKATRKSPSDRYSDAEAMFNDLINLSRDNLDWNSDPAQRFFRFLTVRGTLLDDERDSDITDNLSSETGDSATTEAEEGPSNDNYEEEFINEASLENALRTSLIDLGYDARTLEESTYNADIAIFSMEGNEIELLINLNGQAYNEETLLPVTIDFPSKDFPRCTVSATSFIEDPDRITNEISSFVRNIRDELSLVTRISEIEKSLGAMIEEIGLYTQVSIQSPDQAIIASQIETLLNDHPPRPDLFFLRARFYQLTSDIDLALIDLSTAIQLDPESPSGYGQRARLYRRTGDNDLALADLSKIIELRPESPRGYGQRARFYERTGDINLALIDLSTAIELDPEFALS